MSAALCAQPIAPDATRVEPAAQGRPPASQPAVVLLLPTELPLLRRAANAVRDGVRAALRADGAKFAVRECGYGADGVVAAYRRCVDETVSAVIGPLGRSEVTAIAEAKIPLARPTFLLSPINQGVSDPFLVLAPDLESEAEAIARQSLLDACRKPMLVETSGAIANRVATSVSAFFRLENPATSLSRFELGARDRWQRVTDGWRRDGVDCVLFAGGSGSLFELLPYLRNIAVYITSASYEAELDRIVDWSGVRIADAPLLLDSQRAEFVNLGVSEGLSPTLQRLFALGVDAARLAARALESTPSAEAETNAAAPLPSVRFVPPLQFDGAIGRLQLRSGVYLRTPGIGEFRGRTPVLIGQ